MVRVDATPQGCGIQGGAIHDLLAAVSALPMWLPEDFAPSCQQCRGVAAALKRSN